MGKVLLTRFFNPKLAGVDKVRGRRVLELLLEHTDIGAVLEIAQPEADGRIEIRSTGIIFFDVTTAQNNTEMADDLLGKYRMIVDVHFPAFAPPAIFALDDATGVIAEDDTHVVKAYYSRPEVQTWLHDFLYRAPVLTTPNKSWQQLLRRVNRNVVVLPDVRSPQTAMEFCKQFCWALILLNKPRVSKLERIGDRARFLLGWRALARQLRPHLKAAEAVRSS